MLQKVKILICLVSMVLSACSAPPKMADTTVKPAEVQVLATIHKLHASNSAYPYQMVTQLIQKFNPDLIAIEIRPEDLPRDSAYLAQFYPQEMRQVLKDFPKEKIRGLDWYGEEMRGKIMPSDVFKNEATELGKIKKLNAEMNRDSLLQPKLMQLSGLIKQQVELAGTASPATLNNGRYDSITDQFYQILDEAVKDTRYEAYTRFNTRRDEIITENMLKLIDENPGKRILVLVGANHRSRAIKALQNAPNSQVKIIPVTD